MKLVPVSGREMCRILEALGFVKIHQKGSHVRYAHPDGRKTVVPIHANEKLSIGLVNEILNQIKIDRSSYERLRLKKRIRDL